MRRATIVSLCVLMLAVGFLSWRVYLLEQRPPVIVPVLRAVTLDSNTPIAVLTETAEGEQIAPPETMPLWKYVEQPRPGFDIDLRGAIEADLHNGDATFHLTHEAIDGKEW